MHVRHSVENLTLCYQTKIPEFFNEFAQFYDNVMPTTFNITVSISPPNANTFSKIYYKWKIIFPNFYLLKISTESLIDQSVHLNCSPETDST